MASAITVAPSYTHEQTVAATTWVITHNLHCKPAVTVYIEMDGALQVCLPNEVRIISDNEVQIEFTSARTGKARLV